MAEFRRRTGSGRRILPALILTAVISIAAAQGATITVGAEGCDYSSIQKAIEAAKAGDILSVQSGTYRENLVVDKTLILRGRDTGSGMPAVDGRGVGSAIILNADQITLEGFVVKNAGHGKAGIEVNSDRNYIRNNLITENRWHGIYLSDSDENVITGNVVSKNRYGIWIPAGSDGNRITANELLDNSHGNAVDAGVNRWEMNAYDDLGEGVTRYRITGGPNVDERPKAATLQVEEAETKISTITVKITIPTPIIG
ncbi:right-handed parallel beta-helix repeat-containing protein [Candidatus Methanocrinis natronophilus]|uniref:right-handed parallel beta-helix repeat-containing protein n=1 Tax=Candidatus Methanocrinis natronophilus TaxID=3033396 RepID=UPI002934BE8F|nr:NosD domain-containing protein [Candidatus Methanocrinis natronophilus]